MTRTITTFALIVATTTFSGAASAAFFDGGWIKQQVLGKLSDLIGRRIIVDGELNLDLSWTPSLRAERVRVENAAWSEAPYMVELEVLEASINLSNLLRGQLVLPKLVLTRPHVLLEVSEQGLQNWQFDAGDEVLPQLQEVGDAALSTAVEELRRRQAETEPSADSQQEVSAERTLPLIQELRVDGGAIRYFDHADGVDLSASIDNVSGQIDEQQTRIDARGRFAGQTLALNLQTGSLTDLDRNERQLAVTLRLDAAGSSAVVEGNIRRPLIPAGVDLKVSLEGGAPAELAIVGGVDLSMLPDYRLQTRLRHGADGTWSFDDIHARFGKSDLAGSASYRTADPRPSLDVELASDKLNLAQIGALFVPPGSEERPDQAADGLSTAIPLAPLRQFDADLTLAIAELVTPVGSGFNDVDIEARLRDGLLELTSFDADLGDGGALSAELRFDATAPLSGSARIEARQLRWRALLPGPAPEPFGAGVLGGSLAVELIDTETDGNGVTLRTLLERLRLTAGKLNYRASDAEFSVKLDGGETRRDGFPTLSASADGRYRGEAFQIDFRGDSPAALFAPERPYALDLSLNVADTELSVSGRLRQPLAPRGWNLQWSIAGPDPRRLEPLLGTTLPELPPYRLQGQLERQGSAVLLNRVSGQIGGSDVNGDLRIEPAATPPKIYATLGSRLLDLDDFSGLVEAPPAADGTASAARAEQSAYLLPREPLNLMRIGDAVNGVIHYRAERIDVAGLPLQGVDVTLAVSGQKIELSPLKIGLGGGEMRADVRFDTDRQPVAGELAAQIRRVRLGPLLRPFDIADDSAGTIGGQAKLWVHGNTVAELMASADGGVFLLMTGGKLDSLLVELAGLDISETLIALVGDAGSVPIDCSYLDLQTKDGILKLETAVVDTSDTLFVADGFIDFNQELISLVIEPRPKDFSLLSLRAPLYAQGRLSAPSFFPGSSALTRGTVSALLGVLATPLAALLPLFEAGAGEDIVYCNGLIEAIDRAR